MKPEPFAWAYQNSNTEHQYLVWHKQEGGRNWMPLFTQTDVQEAILAEREAIAQSLDKQADLAGDPMDREWAQEMAAAIRARGNVNEWVGLTKEDFYKKDDETDFVLGMKFAEARLKEKNT